MSDDMETKARELLAELARTSRDHSVASECVPKQHVAAILRAFAEQRREERERLVNALCDAAYREAENNPDSAFAVAVAMDEKAYHLVDAPAPDRTVTFPALPIDPEADALADRIVEDRWRGKVARPLAPTTARDELAPFGHLSRADETQVEVCGERCDEGSECLMSPGHEGGHETQHGCVFYDERHEQVSEGGDDA